MFDPLQCNNIKNRVKPKRWGFGPCISAGVILGYDYGPSSGNAGFIIGAGGMIGFSVHYDLIQW